MRIALFFTYGVSLKTWAETGLLEREIQLYQELKRKYGVDTQFITYGDEKDRAWEKELKDIQLLPIYEYIKRPKSSVLAFIQSLYIPWILRNDLRNVDYFKTNQIMGSWVAVISKWIFQKPVLVRAGYEAYKNCLVEGERSVVQIFLKLISFLAYHQASHIWLNTYEISNFVKKTFKVSPRLITTFPNWIDTNHFKPFSRKNSKINKILYVGRLKPEKNIFLLFSALEGTSITIDLIGDGELRPELDDLVFRSQINVNFMGSIPNNEMPYIYNQYDIYVLCSKYEGNPKTLLEAMACGLAVIGTNVPGIRNIISDGINGLLVSEDASELQRAMHNLLEDATFRQKLGTNARKTILKNNSMQQAIDKEYAIYQQREN